MSRSYWVNSIKCVKRNSSMVSPKPFEVVLMDTHLEIIERTKRAERAACLKEITETLRK